MIKSNESTSSFCLNFGLLVSRILRCNNQCQPLFLPVWKAAEETTTRQSQIRTLNWLFLRGYPKKKSVELIASSRLCSLFVTLTDLPTAGKFSCHRRGDAPH